ncbi:MAG TPA: RDD family protein, partial [Pyrinomonadaceae bacterium]
TIQRATVATAVAYSPTLEIYDELPDIIVTSPKMETQLTLTSADPETFVETLPKLVAVPNSHPTEIFKPEKPSAPKRLIVDDPNDPALNYLDSIDRTLRVDEISNQRASAFRRVICSVFDLITCALLASPIVLALYSKGVDLTATRPLSVIIGSAVLLTFLYFTLSIALTGRTWAMKLFSLRVIDTRTGLIPTGSQSAERAFFYLISLAIAGLGVLYALVSREGDAMHDRFTRTAVIKI